MVSCPGETDDIPPAEVADRSQVSDLDNDRAVRVGGQGQSCLEDYVCPWLTGQFPLMLGFALAAVKIGVEAGLVVWAEEHNDGLGLAEALLNCFTGVGHGATGRGDKFLPLEGV
jgi:hypothetical protein